ncbi:MAG: DUF547 domain-containing protein [bacterium]
MLVKQITMKQMKSLLLAVVLSCLAPLGNAAFDHSHSQWDALLKKHVESVSNAQATWVDYRGFAADRSALKDYLAALSAVSSPQYDAWTRPQKLAFLINAYNAFTVELILTEYPHLKSIRDLGSFLRSPWKKRFFTLLGGQRSLDEIEHGIIRAPGAFDEPRIHMAVNCASIGCPALRTEAYVAERLDSQLEDAVTAFLSDRSRNRASADALSVSKLFDWYGADFERQAGSVAKWLARYADRLADDPSLRTMIAEAKLRVRFLDYDWALNDTASRPRPQQ